MSADAASPEAKTFQQTQHIYVYNIGNIELLAFCRNSFCLSSYSLQASKQLTCVQKKKEL
jgi:hypothetical protein